MKNERTVVGSNYKNEQEIAFGFKGGSQRSGLSVSYLRKAADDPDPQRRLKTVRVGRRRLIRPPDLRDWFNRMIREEPILQNDEPQAEDDEPP